MDDRLWLIYDEINIISENIAIAKLGNTLYMINIDTGEIVTEEEVGD